MASRPDALLNDLRIAACGAELAEVVHGLTRAAYAEYLSLDPPSGEGKETVESVRADLEVHGGAVAWLGALAAGCLRIAVEADHLHVRRVAVLPELQRRGIGRALMAWAESEASHRGLQAVTLGVRLALPGNIAFYQRLGYQVTGRHAHPGYERPTWVSIEKAGSRPRTFIEFVSRDWTYLRSAADRCASRARVGNEEVGDRG